MNRYDYIVVGAGSAGCVVASRLSELDGAQVLLLESGPKDDDPNIWSLTTQLNLMGSARDFAYRTVPQARADNQPHEWPRGRTLGGSSAINGMIYVRGDRTDYDAWAYDGCLGWDYDSILPLFKRSEDFDGPANDYHGVGGPLHVTYNRDPNPVISAMVQGAVELGHAFNPDYNAESTLGVSLIQTTTKDKQRHTTAAAFIHPLNRPNLTVLTGAHAERLLFEGDRCVGVEFSQGGEAVKAFADREVVVSSGAIGSPQLLMLSGIGDAEELAALGIKAVADNPNVGRNLQDHMMCGVTFEAKRPVPVRDENWMQAQLMAKTDSRRRGPDIQPIFMTRPRYMKDLAGPEQGFAFGAGTLRNNSTGSIRLRSGDPNDTPLIDPGYLTTDFDMDMLLASVEVCRAIGHARAMDDWRVREVHPGPAAKTKDSLREYIRQQSYTYYHPVGTCKMGIADDAVVDPELRVLGVRGLRVADASIMPKVPSGNTNAPSIMVGEKCAAMMGTAAA